VVVDVTADIITNPRSFPVVSRTNQLTFQFASFFLDFGVVLTGLVCKSQLLFPCASVLSGVRSELRAEVLVPQRISADSRWLSEMLSDA